VGLFSCRTLQLLKLRLERNMPYRKLGITGTVAPVNTAYPFHESLSSSGLLYGLDKYGCLKDYSYASSVGKKEPK
jgi:hypothetical protein